MIGHSKSEMFSETETTKILLWFLLFIVVLCFLYLKIELIVTHLLMA